jgi:hypothetical protein
MCPSIYICNNQYREFYMYHHLKGEYVGNYAGSSVDTKGFNQNSNAEPYTWVYDGWGNLMAVNNNYSRIDIPSGRTGNRVYWGPFSSTSNYLKWKIEGRNDYPSGSDKRGTHVKISNYQDSPYHLNNCLNGSNLQVYNGNSPDCDTFSLIFKDTVGGWALNGWTPICNGSCPVMGAM